MATCHASCLISQLVLNGLVTGCFLCLLGVAMRLFVLGSGFFNLALGSAYLGGAYAFVAARKAGVPGLLVPTIAVVVSSIAMALVQEMLIFRRLRRVNATPGVMLLSSLSVLLIVQNVMALLFGDQSITVRGPGAEASIAVGGVQLGSIQVVTVVVTIAIVLSIGGFLRLTSLGVQMRAVADSVDLATTIGLSVTRVRMAALVGGCLLVAGASSVAIQETGADPLMGFNGALLAITTLILGGPTLRGIVLGGLVIGVLRQVPLVFLAGQWQDTVVFALLLAVLMVRAPTALAHDKGPAAV